MSHKESLPTCLQKIQKILQEKEKAGAFTEKDKSKLISLVQEMLRIVKTMPTTDSQSKSEDSSGQKSVQVFMHRDTCKQIPEALSKLFKEMAYKCEIRRRTDDLHSDEPLIVICPTTTRLEADIDLVLDKLKWSSAYVTLVLHCGNESSQPGISTENKLPEKEMYQQTEFIDMHVTSESTFHLSQINVDAKENIKIFLDNYYKSKT